MLVSCAVGGKSYQFVSNSAVFANVLFLFIDDLFPELL